MTSREQILAKILSSQPELQALPPDVLTAFPAADPIAAFATLLNTIGGTCIEVSNYEGIQKYILEHFAGQRIVSTLPELNTISEQGWENQDPHSYADVDLAVISAHFGVAENAALWITEDLMHQRAVPFICQQLAVVLSRKEIVQTMHDAYLKIGTADYGFGSFIAGPSKTADIEQSLVLGAHGPKGMTVFLLD
ncbi:LutC/YkgG family protein [Pedobacter nyackensis]|uniref:L-lactate dehydrogenase complex protein LldG n=1 Tax=Pedobacter nyackensis TaxID=475255 RepID=A0A1W2CPH5_9SPHI|nr:LUD domain-containing protein [Pedobacter nyackensis]SMC87109.1 L-lactate dehydrogenase complex protein LldG [Pedobacter nyackensis]